MFQSDAHVYLSTTLVHCGHATLGEIVINEESDPVINERLTMIKKNMMSSIETIPIIDPWKVYKQWKKSTNSNTLVEFHDI